MKRSGFFVTFLLVLAAFCGSPLCLAQEVDTDTPTTNYSVTYVTATPDVILNQHWEMPTLTNPAATGDIDFIRIRGGARLDYLGSHQSPKNFLATGDSPFKLLGKRIGAGLIINSNSYFLYRNIQVSAQGSYKLKIKNSTLSVGLQIGYFHSSFKGSELITSIKPTPGNPGNDGGDNGGDLPAAGEGENPGDEEIGDGSDSGYDLPELPNQDVGGGAFDVALGVRFQHPKFYVGISGLHLTNPKMKLKKSEDSEAALQYIESKLPMTLYFDAGGNIAINNSLFTLQPSIVVASDFSEFQGLAVMRATYNQKFTFGLDYRYNRAFGVLAGMMLKNFYIGYSWEYDYHSSPRGSTGNHEIVVGYQFKMDLGAKSNFSQRSIRIM